MYKCWFFGVWSPSELGHFLYNCHGQIVHQDAEKMPCTDIPDGVFIGKSEVLYKPRLWNTNGWTVYAMWDRSGDSRPGSSSTFIIKGELKNDIQAWNVITAKFPEISQRISDAAKIKR